MAQLLVRNLPESVKEELRERAHTMGGVSRLRFGRSLSTSFRSAARASYRVDRQQ
ncbi:FitA-like ribbon-helix-helix domain-containing protein [Leucobacter coleopterorum]|uniref:FitA-like ribbon-helix-helix domain-containing protein n=1 Tax=Leucobacter coleopterorum TaxID=2714933 RepID=UPI003CC71452